MMIKLEVGNDIIPQLKVIEITDKCVVLYHERTNLMIYACANYDSREESSYISLGARFE